MKSMMKRNDGYALSYVLVVLLVLAAIALAVMTLSLNAVKRQQASIDQMKDKYVAQGMVEQVVAQLENETKDVSSIIFAELSNDAQISYNSATADALDTVIVEAESGTVKVTAKYEIKPLKKNDTSDEGEQIEDSNPILGYEVKCISYKTELISAEGGAEE